MTRLKRWAAAVLVLMMTLLPIYGLTAFAATGRIAFSDPTATVGGQVEVTMKVSSSGGKLSTADIMLAYDPALLEFTEGTNADGGNGAIRVHGDGGSSGSETLAYKLKFNALSAGTGKITVTNQEVYDSDSKLVTIDRQGDSTVTVSALATASSDAALKSLQVSPGTLVPEFSPEVDSYSVTVGTGVDKLVISAETSDENAAKVVSGNENLQMGENRVSLKVTAQDGETTKEYVIVVTKAEGGASETESADSFKMRVTERTITVLSPDASVEVPEGFKESTIKIDGHEVKGWVWGSEAEHQYCVIYGMNEAGEKNFYRYDLQSNERTIQRYFADPAAEGAVTEEVYTQLAESYDSLRSDFNLFRILLIAAVVVCLILMVLLVAAMSGGKKRSASKTSRKPSRPETEDREVKRAAVGKAEPVTEEAEPEIAPEEYDEIEEINSDEWEEDDPEIEIAASIETFSEKEELTEEAAAEPEAEEPEDLEDLEDLEELDDLLNEEDAEEELPKAPAQEETPEAGSPEASEEEDSEDDLEILEL